LHRLFTLLRRRLAPSVEGNPDEDLPCAAASAKRFLEEIELLIALLANEHPAGASAKICPMSLWDLIRL
jgi:hypothetical protein